MNTQGKRNYAEETDNSAMVSMNSGMVVEEEIWDDWGKETEKKRVKTGFKKRLKKENWNNELPCDVDVKTK